MSADSPGIDSLIIIHLPPGGSPPIFLIFWIAHKAEALSPDTHKYYVVVIPGGVVPGIRVPEEYFCEGEGKGAWQSIPDIQLSHPRDCATS